MKWKIPFIILLAFTSLILACKKDNDDGLKVVAGKIHNKWQIDSILIIQHLNGTNDTVNQKGSSEDYVDFRSDGKMITYFQGRTETSSYSLREDTVLVINGDSAFIVELTENKFILFTKAEAGSIGYVKITYYLKR